MAEPDTDAAVDRAITHLDSAMDALKTAQRKDDAAWSNEDEETPRDKQPTNLKDAKVRVREHFRRAREQAWSNSK